VGNGSNIHVHGSLHTVLISKSGIEETQRCRFLPHGVRGKMHTPSWTVPPSAPMFINIRRLDARN
jgi:hypothetical protein